MVLRCQKRQYSYTILPTQEGIKKASSEADHLYDVINVCAHNTGCKTSSFPTGEPEFKTSPSSPLPVLFLMHFLPAPPSPPPQTLFLIYRRLWLWRILQRTVHRWETKISFSLPNTCWGGDGRRKQTPNITHSKKHFQLKKNPTFFTLVLHWSPLCWGIIGLWHSHHLATQGDREGVYCRLGAWCCIWDALIWLSKELMMCKSYPKPQQCLIEQAWKVSPVERV